MEYVMFNTYIKATTGGHIDTHIEETKTLI